MLLLKPRKPWFDEGADLPVRPEVVGDDVIAEWEGDIELWGPSEVRCVRKHQTSPESSQSVPCVAHRCWMGSLFLSRYQRAPLLRAGTVCTDAASENEAMLASSPKQRNETNAMSLLSAMFHMQRRS